MSTPLLSRLDTLAHWRRGLDRGVAQFVGTMEASGLLDANGRSVAAALRQRLASDRLVLAFVAEFSRGKSELINALFFADTGRRVLPATPGRTTMCPVELAWDPQLPPSLALLPIATRAGGQSVVALREQPALWQDLPLPVGDGQALADALQAVTRVQKVTLAQARSLGFWNDERPEDNPPLDAQDMVEVPAWRHALINYPHPLLKRGLVVLDTPGLNAIGAEPELTLSLLPSAHAAVFLLSADTGVTKSDLSVWRDHLGDRGCERFVVLNKIDMLADPLLSAEQVAAQVQRQRDDAAATLGIGGERVFAISARQALTARMQGDATALDHSGLLHLEHALLNELLPQRTQVIGRMVEDGVLALQQAALRKLDLRQRQHTEQLAELRGLRGKSSARLQLMGRRLEGEAADFERCAPRLAALRAVLARQQQAMFDQISADRLRDMLREMRKGSQSSLFRLGSAKAFARLGEQMHAAMAGAEGALDELDQMVRASVVPLNAEFGLSIEVPLRPALDGHSRELIRVREGYSRYVGVAQLWRMAQPDFLERFCRLLQSRVRVVFESACQDVELWTQDISSQIDSQLRERRQALVQRREAHSRIRQAEDGLERSIAGIESVHAQGQRLVVHLEGETDALRRLAAMPPVATPGAVRPGHLQLVAASAAA